MPNGFDKLPIHQPSELPKFDTVEPRDVPYYITGTDTPHEKRIREMIGAMKPANLPEQIAILPRQRYDLFTRQLEKGQIQGMKVNHERIGNAVSLGGRIWMADDILDDPYKLPHAIGHEMSHRDLNTNSEDKAEAGTKPFMDRYKQCTQSGQCVGFNKLPKLAQGQ